MVLGDEELRPVGSKVSTLLAQQLMTCSSAVPYVCLLPPDGTCVALTPHFFLFGSIPNYHFWFQKWLQLWMVTKFMFSLWFYTHTCWALLGLCQWLGVWSELHTLVCGLLSTMQALLQCDVYSPIMSLTFTVPKLIPLGCKNMSLVSQCQCTSSQWSTFLLNQVLLNRILRGAFNL